MNSLRKIKQWNYGHAIGMLAGLLMVLLTRQYTLISGLAFISFGIFVGLNWSLLQSYRPFAGYANWVTLTRLIMVLGLPFLWEQIPERALLLFCIAILITDGIDGYLARKMNQISDFGAYLDMETDTLLVCILCTAYYLDGFAGAWILVVGYLRYLYVGAILLFRLQGRKEKSTRFAKTIAVIFFISLLFPLAFPDWLAWPALVLAAVLVSGSFLISFYHLIRAKEE